MKYQLSVICPGIRTNNWKRLYDSIGKSFSGLWEVIFVGPYDLPEELKGIKNIIYIKDWGTPIRAQQIGLCESEGKLITWAADDGEYLPGALDVGYAILANEDFNPMTLVMGKYTEGEGDTEPMHGTEYYILSRHDASRSIFLPANYLMLNVGIVSREVLIDVGGWDCQFEVCPMSYNDLAIRLQNHGVKFIVQDQLMFKCSHLPGLMGDHGPVHNAQVYHDQPLFRKIYNDPSCIKRTVIPLDNFKFNPERWARRFGISETTGSVT